MGTSCDLGPFEACPQCREYGFRNRHKCAPLWYARKPDWDESDAWQIHAADATAAAEIFASRLDSSGTYDIAYQGQDMMVEIRQTGLDDWQAFEVTGCMEPRYRAEARICPPTTSEEK